MKDRVKYYFLIIVFVGIIVFVNVVDPIMNTMQRTGAPLGLAVLRFIIVAAIVVAAFTVIGKVMHDDRIQEPYRSIFGLAILGLVALAAWYLKTHYWWFN